MVNSESDEELSLSLKNLILLIMLIDKNLPNLVKQRYGTELRSRTLASLKPEISHALDSLLDKLHSSEESKVLSSAFRSSSSKSHRDRQSNLPKPQYVPNRKLFYQLCKQLVVEIFHTF